MVAAEGWVVLGRGGGAKYNLQEQHLLFQINKKTAEKAAIENKLDDSGDEPDGAAAGNEETVDVPRHRHAAVGRDEWQPGHRRQVGSAAGGLESRGYVGGAEGG